MHRDNSCSFAAQLACASLALACAASALPAVAVAQQITTAASTVAISPRQVQIKVSVGPGGSLLYVNEAGESQPLPESGLWCVPGTAQAFAVQPDEGYVVSSVSFNGQQREGMMRTFSVIPGKDSELNVLFVSEADAGLTDTTPGWHQTAFGSSYWRDKNGRLAMGKRTIEDKTYVFTSGGLMVTGWRNLFGSRRAPRPTTPTSRAS